MIKLAKEATLSNFLPITLTYPQETLKQAEHKLAHLQRDLLNVLQAEPGTDPIERARAIAKSTKKLPAVDGTPPETRIAAQVAAHVASAIVALVDVYRERAIEELPTLKPGRRRRVSKRVEELGGKKLEVSE